MDEKDEGEKVKGELAEEVGAEVVCWNPLCTAAAAAAAMNDDDVADWERWWLEGEVDCNEQALLLLLL